MLKTNQSNIIKIKPSEIEGFILLEYGIKTDILFIDNKHIIKVYNHLSLFSIIQKIRRNFDFTIHHKFDKNEYIIILNNKYEISK